MNYLYCLFPAFVLNNIFYRVHAGKQHGIIPDSIDKDIKLVIAPDSSSNDYLEHEYLYKNGIDGFKYIKNLYKYHNLEVNGYVYWRNNDEIVAIEKGDEVLYKE